MRFECIGLDLGWLLKAVLIIIGVYGLLQRCIGYLKLLGNFLVLLFYRVEKFEKIVL